MNKKIALLICLSTYSLLAAAPSFAACTGASPTWNSTADQASVTTCITNAKSGDTINVAAGSATWSAITITKAIHLIGAGVGNTVITQSGSLAYLPVLADVNNVFELAGFTFQGNVTHLNETGWGQTPPITGLKIHNNAFNGSTTVRAIWMDGLEFGVVYNNTFSGNFIALSVIGAGAANGNFYPLCFGCASYPYIENNTFGQGAGAEFITETGQGGRMVLRHNTINGYDPGGGSELFDVHGEQNSGGWTATSEYYHNSTAGVGVGSTPFRWMHLRGGQALIMNNTINRNIAFNITEYQAWGGNGICHNYPVAYNASEVYCTPISASCKETQINNSFFFNNIAGGSQQTPSYTEGSGGSCGADPPWGDNTFVQQNREFWIPSFGLESALPLTCTANGNTYYGTTDSDKIFKCTSTNTWTLFYKPYTFPHPLSVSPTFVKGCVVGNESATSSITTPSCVNTAGNFLIITTTAVRPFSTLAISDTVGDTFVNANPAVFPFHDTIQDGNVYVWYVASAKGGSPNTFTITPTSGNSALEIHVSEWSGMSGWVPDTGATSVSNGTTGGSSFNSGSKTTASDGELIFGYTFPLGNSVSGPGYVQSTFVNGDLDEYLTQPVAASISTTFTSDNNGTWLALMQPFMSQGVSSAVVSLAPTSLNFGSQTVNTTSATQTTTLTNTGTATLTIGTISLTGANPGDFSILSNTSGASLGVGSNCVVGVKFTPTTTGARAANLTFPTNASTSPDNVALTGTGTGAAVASFNPSSLVFNGIKLGLSSAATTIVLTNTGNITMNISAIGFTGTNAADFSETTTCGATLGAGLSCNINVTFTPRAQGTRSASVSVTSDATGSPNTAPISGVGFNPITGTGTISGTGTITIQP